MAVSRTIISTMQRHLLGCDALDPSRRGSGRCDGVRRLVLPNSSGRRALSGVSLPSAGQISSDGSVIDGGAQRPTERAPR